VKKKILFQNLILIVIVTLLVGCVNNTQNENSNGNKDSWLDDYSPIHKIGNGTDEFWIEFPVSSKNTGEPINHLSWILKSLESNCVVFVVHKTGCVSCTPQAERVINLSKEYETQIEFYDLDIPLGGEIAERAYESYLYDPNGPPGYIALTGIFTYVEYLGESKIGWHAWEGNVIDSEMEDWIKDAIYYYHLKNGVSK
jgi:hypothetical protein